MAFTINKSSLRGQEEQFAAAVAGAAAELNAWRDRELVVVQAGPAPDAPRKEAFRKGGGYDEEGFQKAMGEWRVAKANHPTPFPEPRVDPLIRAAVVFDEERKQFVPAYEVIDDTPPPPPEPSPEEKLEARKQELVGELRLAERNALAALVPERKTRLRQLRLEEISRGDQARVAALNARMAELSDANGRLSLELGELKEQGKSDEALRKKLNAGIEKMQAISAIVRDIEAYHRKERPPEDTAVLDAIAETARATRAIQLKAAQAEADIEDLTLETVEEYRLPTF